MDDKTLNKIKKYKDKKDILKLESNLIYKKINRLKAKIETKKKKQDEIDKNLLKICIHKWIPDIANYNVYDRPKYCKICLCDK